MKKKLIILAGIILIFSNCKMPSSKYQNIDFSNFISQVANASFGNYKGLKQVAVIDEESFNEMKQYLLKRYQNVHVRQSFLGKDGQVVDCIPLEEQPASRLHDNAKIKTDIQPPPHDKAIKPSIDSSNTKMPISKSIDIALHKGEKDKYGNEMYCPHGYIPVKRITLEILTHFKTLKDYFRKAAVQLKHGDVPASYGDGYDHNHVVGTQTVDNAGGNSWLNVWSPSSSPGKMSLSQQWFVGGSGDATQTIEGGWQVLPDKYNTDDACLFIYSTNANYSDGSGGYNLDNGEFIQVSNEVYLGAPFDHYSTTNGTQWGFNLQWKRNTDGNWWLFYTGPGDWIAVGYYPKSFYGTGQLSNFAQRTDFGGEVAGDPKEGQMGSGAQASDGWQKAAYQNRIFYIQKDNIDQGIWSTLSLYEENSACYTGDVQNSSSNWATYLFFGGNSCN
jgi:hypothetical protein